MFTASPDGSTTYFNKQGTEYTGLHAEPIPLELAHAGPSDDVESAERAWKHAIATGTEFDCEYRIRRHDGAFRWHAARAVPLRNDDGHIYMWIGTATDIEHHKQREFSLRELEREASAALTLLESIEAAAPVGFKLVDRDFRIVRMNQLLARANGLPADEQIGRTVAEVVPDLWPSLEPIYRRALAGEAVSHLDLSVPNAEAPGQVRHWLASYYPVRVNGEIVGVGNVLFDITERKEAEEFLRVVMDNMAEGLYTLDADGCLTYLNPAAWRMLGWTAEELLGKRMHEAVHFQRADGTPFPARTALCCTFATKVARSECLTTHSPAKTGRSSRSRTPPRRCKAAPRRRAWSSCFAIPPRRREEQASLQRQLATLTWVGRIRDAIDENRLVLHSQPIGH